MVDSGPSHAADAVLSPEQAQGEITEGARDPTSRPTTPLRLVQLFQISVYWLALNAIWGGWELFQQKRVPQLVGDETAPIALGAMEILAMPIAALTMPVMGSISDYTTTRWGRRKPFVLVGSIAAMLSIAGVAIAPVFGIMVLFFVLTQLTTNVARGPFAGMVPDLVPEQQVGIASGLMGLMIQAGLIGGYLLMMTGYLLNEDFTLPMLIMGVVVGATGIGTFLWVPAGPPGKDRRGRSWPRVAAETFGTDILQERSYIWLLGSRFFMLMATGFFANLNILYLEQSLGLTGSEQAFWVLVALAVYALSTMVGTIPGARLSDRVGRKPIIFGSAALGAIGMFMIAVAPGIEVALVAMGFVGVSAGAFLSVDWALMTDIIPKASAGRYMGMSNIVEATNGPMATAIGGTVAFLIGGALGLAVGYRAAMAMAILMFGLGAALLVPVREPRRSKPARREPPAAI
jgi:MFS family permease